MEIKCLMTKQNVFHMIMITDGTLIYHS